MVVDRIVGQRMHQDVETFAVQHQPRYDGGELGGIEDDLELRDGVRADRLAAGTAALDAKPLHELLAQPLGERAGAGIVIDMRVIAANCLGFGGSFVHGVTSREASRLWQTRAPPASRAARLSGL